MTARNAKGRFVSDAEHAADLLLERAVAEAVRVLRVADFPVRYILGADPAVSLTMQMDHVLMLPPDEPDNSPRARAEAILRHAAESASLLIDRRPAA